MKKNSLILLLIGCCFGLANAQQGKALASPKISNGIKLNLSKELKLVKAYLFFEGGEHLDASNTADLNQNVKMMIQIDGGGWVEKDQKVSIGASEKITTSLGSVILNEPDLFATFTDIGAEDAQYITLKAVINSITNKKIKFFTVSFTIWDKWGTGKITGSYRFKIRE